VVQERAGRPARPRCFERPPHLPENLRLAHHLRIEPGRDQQQVPRGAVTIHVYRGFELIKGDAAQIT
jgi:hypothetical protein